MASPNTKRTKPLNYCDLYSTPVEAIDKLCGIVDFSGKSILEPCAGLNVIKDAIISNTNTKVNIKTMDLFDHGCEYDYPNTDFLSWDYTADNHGVFDTIVTNPPYKLAMEFILKGFEVAPVQYHLLRLNFLEGKERLQKLYTHGYLDKVMIFSGRISCPEGKDRVPTANSVAYAWLCFDKTRDVKLPAGVSWL